MKIKVKAKVTFHHSIHICTLRYYATFGVANGLLAESEKVTNFPPLKKIKSDHTRVCNVQLFNFEVKHVQLFNFEVKHYS